MYAHLFSVAILAQAIWFERLLRLLYKTETKAKGNRRGTSAGNCAYRSKGTLLPSLKKGRVNSYNLRWLKGQLTKQRTYFLPLNSFSFQKTPTHNQRAKAIRP